jgi:hypothetical protein
LAFCGGGGGFFCGGGGGFFAFVLCRYSLAIRLPFVCFRSFVRVKVKANLCTNNLTILIIYIF